MANSYTQITITDDGGVADKDNTEFSFDFDYINTGDIKAIVSLNPEAETPTWTDVLTNSGATGDFDANGIDATNKKIKLAATPSASSSAVADSALRIYRSTTVDALVDFQGGSRIAEADLDNAYRQGLFAAQEVSENGSTLGGAGGTVSLTTNSVALAHMTDDSVDTDELRNDAVTTAKIEAGAVGATELASTLNLTGKAITYPAGSIGEASLKTDLDLSSHVLTLPVKNGEILDRVSSAADGNTQLTKHTGVGVWTWPDAVGVQELTGTMADVVGSVVCYTPPANTSRVEYEYNFTVARDGDTPSLGMFKLYIAGADAYDTEGTYVEVTNAKFTVGSANQYGTRAHFKWVFHVGNDFYGSGSGNDAAHGAVSTWGASRFIKIMGREFDNRAVKLNQMYFWDESSPSGGSDTTAEWASSISYPVLTITSVK